MIYSQINDHIHAVINSLQSDYREWQDGFNFRNVPETIFDKAYHVDIAPSIAGAEQNDRSILEPVQVRLTFLRKGYNRVQDVILNCLNDVHCFKLVLIDQKTWKDFGNIRKVAFSGLGKEEFDESDDNDFIITLDLEYTLHYKTA